jgi:hypothetical protein
MIERINAERAKTEAKTEAAMRLVGAAN